MSLVQADQAFQSYQQGRQSLIQAKASLESALDGYKLNLGLPPDVGLKLDDALLNPFQLASPNLEKLQEDLDRFFATYRELDKAPPLEQLQTGFKQLKSFLLVLGQLTEEVVGELGRWRPEASTVAQDKAQRKREQSATALERQMPEFHAELTALARELAKEEVGLTEATRGPGWEVLQKRARQLIADAAQLYVVQTQVRVSLIQLEPIPYALDEACSYARDNRLDLMNQRAQVVDAWRQIDVTANALKAGLDVKMSANIATPPGSQQSV